MKKLMIAASASVALLALSSATRAADCDVTVGVVMELTGPAGAYGQAGAKSVEMAFRDINDAGGVINGCKLVTDTRDSQSQGNVAVDAATQLVQVKKVPAVIGGIISSVSIPILTSGWSISRRVLLIWPRRSRPSRAASSACTLAPEKSSSSAAGKIARTPSPMNFRVSPLRAPTGVTIASK